MVEGVMGVIGMGWVMIIYVEETINNKKGRV